MEVASLLIAVLGVVLGAASLAWQAATYVLSGGRVKAALRLGAFANSGTGLLTVKADGRAEQSLAEMAAQGYGKQVVAVTVRNVGRLPVTVSSWGLHSDVGVTLTPVGDSIGPNLPHRLEAGESETWAVPLAQAHAFITSAREALKARPQRPGTLFDAFFRPPGNRVRAVVELADGRRRRSRERIQG